MVKSINFDDLVEALKGVEGASVKDESHHKDGVFKSVSIHIEPYDLKIEYVEIGKNYTSTSFYATKGNEPPIHLQSVVELSELLGFQVSDNLSEIK